MFECAKAQRDGGESKTRRGLFKGIFRARQWRKLPAWSCRAWGSLTSRVADTVASRRFAALRSTSGANARQHIPRDLWQPEVAGAMRCALLDAAVVMDGGAVRSRRVAYWAAWGSLNSKTPSLVFAPSKRRWWNMRSPRGKTIGPRAFNVEVLLLRGEWRKGIGSAKTQKLKNRNALSRLRSRRRLSAHSNGKSTRLTSAAAVLKAAPGIPFLSL